MNKKLIAVASAIVFAVGITVIGLQSQSEVGLTVEPSISEQEYMALQNIRMQAQELINQFSTLPAFEVVNKVNNIASNVPTQILGIQIPASIVAYLRNLAAGSANLVSTLQSNLALFNDQNLTLAGQAAQSLLTSPQDLFGAITLLYTIAQSQLPQSIKNLLVAQPMIPGDAGVLDTLKKVVDSQVATDKLGVAALQQVGNAIAELARKVYANKNNLAAVNFANEVNTIKDTYLSNAAAIDTLLANYNNNINRIIAKAQLVKAEEIVQAANAVQKGFNSFTSVLPLMATQK